MLAPPIGMPCLLTTGELLDPRLPWAPNFAGRQSVMITLRRASAALILALRALTRAGCTWSNWHPWQYLASLRSGILCINLHLHTRHLLGSGSGGNPDWRRWSTNPSCLCSGEMGIVVNIIWYSGEYMEKCI